ncbi:MAG: hypothetical protein KDE69_06495 [Burkholderiaceae bacterium]|nr:hypothetical protein [Burkholderiaceae bacterium]
MLRNISPQSSCHESRVHFAAQYAFRHLGISAALALVAAAIVFGLLYPAPYRTMLGVGPIFLLVLMVDVVCGPLLTLIVASPKKLRRERRLDLGLIGIIQLLALAYGLHSVWVARPAVLAFEADRLVVVKANEIELADMVKAPESLRRLSWWGVQKVGTRRAANGAELIASVERGLAGISLAQQPGWWIPWEQTREALRERAKPMSELLARRPSDAEVLRSAARATGQPVNELWYLPLTSSKTLAWIALLDSEMDLVGYAPVDGF